MTKVKKWILGLSICMVMLISAVVGIAGVRHSKNISSDNSPKAQWVNTVPVSYTFEPSALVVKQGGSEINYEYQPSRDAGSANKAYEYCFGNVMNDTMIVNLKNIDSTDVNISYHFSPTKLDKNSVTASTNEFKMPKIESGEKVYIYIIVSPKNATIPATFTSSIVWWQGMAGNVTWVLENSAPIAQEIVKGQIVTPPAIEVADGYQLAYYQDSNYTKSVDITTHQVQGGIIYIRLEKLSLLAFEYVSKDGGYYVVTGLGQETSKDIVIPARYRGYPVKEIADWAFGDSEYVGIYDLNSVVISEGVTTIGKNAFGGQWGLTTVNLPSTVTAIGAGAFNGCYVLESINIPEGVTVINNGIFDSCYSLKSITIPSSVTSIGSYAFYNCYSITSVTIPSGVTSMGDWAFDRCENLSNVDFEDPNGWSAGSTSLSSTDLANTSTAATYLKSTYSGDVWTKS